MYLISPFSVTLPCREAQAIGFRSFLPLIKIVWNCDSVLCTVSLSQADSAHPPLPASGITSPFITSFISEVTLQHLFEFLLL
uniref:Uncharacterized protein n=1 Tax=Cyanistes caeruleus TaxID=156563 RepID=A0A8C0ZKG5_CYACU